MRAYLLGSGWWTLWHLFLWGLLLCVAGLTWWLWIVKPGKGPQGGEFAAMLLLLFFLGWTLASFVHAMMATQGYVKAGAVWLLGWSIYCWLVYKLTNQAASGASLEVLSRRRSG